MSKRLKVGVIFGGCSQEHDVSVVSAVSVMKAMDSERYDIIPIGINRDFSLSTRAEVLSMLMGEGLDYSSIDFPYEDLVLGLFTSGSMNDYFDVLFPVLHGPNGEDGVVQGIFEGTGIPYVGSGVLASAISMDKDIMKKLVSFHNIPILPYLTLRKSDWDNDVYRSEFISDCEEKLSYPVFVKPANLGSSVGISKVYNSGTIDDAILLAFKYDNKLVIEQGRDVRELEIALLGKSGALELSVVGEIVPSGDFYDYEAKYGGEASELIIPADIDDNTRSRIEDIGIKVFSILECFGLARADFFLDKESGEVHFNEVNTMPGFTDKSMYPKLFDYKGISYSSLIDKLIQLAFLRP